MRKDGTAERRKGEGREGERKGIGKAIPRKRILTTALATLVVVSEAYVFDITIIEFVYFESI